MNGADRGEVRRCRSCGTDLEAKAQAEGVSLDPLAIYCGMECDPREALDDIEALLSHAFEARRGNGTETAVISVEGAVVERALEAIATLRDRLTAPTPPSSRSPHPEREG